MFVLWPLMTYGLYLAAGLPWSLWDVYEDDPILDNGPLWFVEALLIYSLIYAAWVWWRARRGHAPNVVAGRPLRARSLVALGAGVAIVTFIVRLWIPFDSLQFTNAHLWQWPECIALGLGIVSAGAGGSSRSPSGSGGDAGGGARRDRGTVRGIRVDTGFRIGDRSVRGRVGLGGSRARDDRRCDVGRRVDLGPRLRAAASGAAPAEPSEHLAAPRAAFMFQGFC